jgi:hypothetical protein
MTVAELAKSLEGLDPKMYVAVVHENEGNSEFLHIGHVAPGFGTPVRSKAGKPGFMFGKDGPEEWLFITAAQD